MSYSAAQAERIREHVCLACGLEPAVHNGKRWLLLGTNCGARNARQYKLREARNEGAQDVNRSAGGRGRAGVPKRCEVCLRPGHTIKTCSLRLHPAAVDPAIRRKCLRCRDDAQAGKLHCVLHEKVLVQIGRGGSL